MDCEDKFLLNCMIMAPKIRVSFNCVAIRQTMQAIAKQQERCLLSTAKETVKLAYFYSKRRL